MARAGLRSSPRNVTDVTRVLVRLDGGVRNDAVSAKVASLRTEDALPIRQFYTWPGKRNYEGAWCRAPTAGMWSLSRSWNASTCWRWQSPESVETLCSGI